MVFKKVAVLLSVLAVCHSKVVDGVIFKENTQWEFLAKFVFKKGGEGTYLNVKANEFDGEKAGLGQNILLYHDVENGFPSVWESGRSCRYKESKAERVVPISSLSGEGITWSPKNTIPRHWYIAISNCNPTNNATLITREVEQAVHASYTITFKNGGAKFRGHFSDDTTGVFEACIVFFILLAVLVAMYAYSFLFMVKDRANMARTIVLIGGTGVFVHFFANLLEVAHLDSYSNDGIGIPSLHSAVLFLEQVPEIIFMTLMLLLAKGSFISSPEIQSQRGLIEVVTVYSVLVVAMIAWGIASLNDVYEEYLYSTPFGVTVIVARMIVFFIFVSTIWQTRSRESLEVKRRFYLMFLFFGVYFFLTLPVSVLLASAFPHYHVKKADYIMANIFDIIGYSFVWGFFATGKGGFVKSEDQVGGHAVVSNHDEDDTETRI